MLPQRSDGGRAREAKSPGKQSAQPRINHPGSQGRGWPGGMKPLRRRCEAVGFRKKARERKGVREIDPRSTGRRKALKGKAHERWRLEYASEVPGADAAERVAKPCGWDFRWDGQLLPDALERE
jgi:hypothetical protein